MKQNKLEIVDGVEFAGRTDAVRFSDVSEVVAQMTPDQRAHIGLPSQFPEPEYDPLKADREVKEGLERIYEKL